MSLSLEIRCPAQARFLAPVRHALDGLLRALAFDRRFCEDVTTAVGEALANIVEHAYCEQTEESERFLELRAGLDRERLEVEVADCGSFVTRVPLPGRGFGLRIMRAIATELDIDTTNGTRLHMIFTAES